MWLPAWRGTWPSRQGKEKELAEWSEETTLKKKKTNKKNNLQLERREGKGESTLNFQEIATTQIIFQGR